MNRGEVKLAQSIGNGGLMLTNKAYPTDTEDQCKELYLQAEEIASVAATSIKDGLQGRALLSAKKIICGDYWDKDPSKIKKENGRAEASNRYKNYQDFLKRIKCTNANSSYLLDFAGYKEAEEVLIAEGADITPIDTASHYREVKKQTEEKTPEAISKTYTEAVEHTGSVPKTAVAVKEAVAKTGERVYVQDIFEDEVGKRPEVLYAQMFFGNEVLKKVPSVTPAQWKKFYRNVAACVHPDKGGTEQDMEVLARLNEMMNLVIDQTKSILERKAWDKDYIQWKTDKGYESDWVNESEL